MIRSSRTTAGMALLLAAGLSFSQVANADNPFLKANPKPDPNTVILVLPELGKTPTDMRRYMGFSCTDGKIDMSLNLGIRLFRDTPFRMKITFDDYVSTREKFRIYVANQKAIAANGTKILDTILHHSWMQINVAFEPRNGGTVEPFMVLDRPIRFRVGDHHDRFRKFKSMCADQVKTAESIEVNQPV